MRAPAQVGRRDTVAAATPGIRVTQIEIRADGQREDRALDQHDAQRAPEHQAPRAEGARRQRADVERSRARSYRASGGRRFVRPRQRAMRESARAACRLRRRLFGQNQPTIVTNTGTAP